MKTISTILLLLGLGFYPAILRSQDFIINDVDNAVKGVAANQFNYTGQGWVHATNTTDPYFMKTVSYSNKISNTVTIAFTGNEISIFSAKASHHGIMGVSFDGGPEVSIDLYSSSRQNSVLVYTSFPDQQEARNHTVTVRVTGTKNTASTNTYAIIDYVQIRTASTNTSLGANANFYKSGTLNTALGAFSLSNNLLGAGGNTAVGAYALGNNFRGGGNIAVGVKALLNNDRGGGNIAIGASALHNNYDAGSNIGVGDATLFENSGWANTAIGSGALAKGTGWFNTALGFGAGMGEGTLALDNTTAMGSQATVTASNQVRIGNSQVTSIGGQVSWSTLSDGRFKKDVKEDVSGLEFINGLRPVSYVVDKDALDKFLKIPDSIRTKFSESRKKFIRETGFVAQEVESLITKSGYVFNGVEQPKNENDHYSIRYAEFVVPLVKAVQELTVKLEDQDKKILTLVNQLEKHGLKPADGLPETSDEAELHQNNPNPFSADTEIKVSLPETVLNARVIIYNMEGKQLKNYPVQDRGNTSVKISGAELNAGMYLYALIVDGKVVDTKRMILTN